jgi:CHASE3 domain sensor protein
MYKEINMKDLVSAVTELQEKLEVIGRLQLAIVDEIAEIRPGFQAKFVSIVLAQDKIREEFTEHINKVGDDDTKTMMMELNQIAEDLKENTNDGE